MKFDVETGQVNTMVQSYQETLNQISQNREKMYQALESLNGMQQGSAHDAFTAQYQLDNQEMQQLLRELQRVAENISKARVEYDTCEQNVKSEIAAIQI